MTVEDGEQRERCSLSDATHSASARGMPVNAMHELRKRGAGEDEQDHAGQARRAHQALPRSSPR